jgi:hypothetical protein
MFGNTGNANLTTNTTTQGTINFKEGNLKAECLEQNADETFQVVKIDPVTHKLFRATGSGGGGGGGDVFLSGQGATKENLYTDDTKNEFKGEIVFGTGTAGEPKTVADMDANDRILSVDATGKLATNTRINYLQKNALAREEVESLTFFSNVDGLEVRNKLELVDSANPGGFAKIELDHFAPADNNNIPIHHFSFVKSGEATGVPQMALASDILMIRDGDLLVDDTNEPDVRRGKPPDKGLAYSTASGEISYVDIASPGVGDAVLADANTFTAVNTFDVSVDTKLLKLSNTIPFVGTTEYAELEYEIATVGVETNLRSDRNLVVRNKTESSGIGSTLTIDSLDADWANPSSIPRSTLQFRVTNPANLNDNNTGVIDYYGYAAGSADRKFTVSDTMEVTGNITAYDGSLIFGNSSSPLTITQTESSGPWTLITTETGYLNTHPEPPMYMVTTYTQYVNGSPNNIYKRVDFRGTIICSTGVVVGIDNKPFIWANNLGLPTFTRRHIVKVLYFVLPGQSPTNASSAVTLPHAMFYRYSSGSGNYCQLFDQGTIIGLTPLGIQQKDLGYNFPGTEVYINNTFYYTN